MMPIQIWSVPLNYDFRNLLAWGLEHFAPAGDDHEMKIVMETAIRDKAAEVLVDGHQLDYLDRLGCAAFNADDAVRIDADKFLRALPNRHTTKPAGVRETVKAVKQKGLAFD